MLLSTLHASLLENILDGIGAIAKRQDRGSIERVMEIKRKRNLRAGYGSTLDFNTATSFN